MTLVSTWVELEIIILSEVNQKETNSMWYHLYVESKVWHKWTYLWNRHTHRPREENCGCLYAESIMRNAGLEEAQAGIKIAGGNINNFRYADDITLMAESWKVKVKVKSVSRVRLFATPWTPGFSVRGFSRQEYWSGLPFPSLRNLPDPGIEPRSPAL